MGCVHAPPERIALTPVGAAVRRWRGVADLDEAYAAMEASRAHLRPFMPWADQSRQEAGQFLVTAQEQWLAGTDYQYAIVDDTTGSVLGGCGLHARQGPGALEIGYWLRAGATGRGVATAAAGALTRAAAAVGGIERVEIWCDQTNLRSSAVPRRLGYRLDRLEDKPSIQSGEPAPHEVWVLLVTP
jgi:RimJ/RimL family protein N-acetyltransferase